MIFGLFTIFEFMYFWPQFRETCDAT